MRTLQNRVVVFPIFSLLLSNALTVFGQGQGVITRIPDEIHRRATQCVVKVLAKNGERQGSGIVIARTAKNIPIIVTANQLISGSETELSIQLENESEPYPAILIIDRWRNDYVALIAPRAPLPLTPALHYGASALIAPGDAASVLGYPNTSFLSQNSGKVILSDRDKLVVDFQIAEGQAGGPVLDSQGRIIGIALPGGKELGHAVPIDVVRLMIDQWLGKARLSESWTESRQSGKWYGWVVGVALLAATATAIAVSGVLD